MRDSTYANPGMNESDQNNEPEQINVASLKRLRAFKDVLKDTPVIVLYVGETPFNIESIPVSSRRDLIKMVAHFEQHQVVLVHATVEVTPLIDQQSQLIGARIYVLDDIPDLVMTANEKVATGFFKNHVSLDDYLELLADNPTPVVDTDPSSDQEETELDD